MKREDYEAEIEALDDRQRGLWLEARRAYMDMRGCSLGLCGQLDAIEEIAQTNPDADKRKEAADRARAMRAERKQAWDNRENLIAQIEVAKDVLRRRADGRL